ncbi:MAG TPA: aminoglycoside phosphotransferase, partial [Ruminiclostridium sp.]|nr:aminoglycoside phosphotransferase [Ruminiclostridium sp.]
MKKGRLLGSGLTAEVYEWGQDKILKLYFKKYSNDDWVNHEAEVGYLVHESGLMSPAVFDKV